MEIKINYCGEWPNLCSGHLRVTIDSEEWDFGTCSLSSGGECGFHDTIDWESYCRSGPWEIDEDNWPLNFPENLKEVVLEKINEEIEWGCCGGCL